MSEEPKAAEAELSDADKAAIVAVRTQRDAKAAAEKFTGKGVRPKQVRGYCCLFVDGADYTDYFGYDWQGAFMKLVFLIRLGAASAKSQELVKSASSAKSAVEKSEPAEAAAS